MGNKRLSYTANVKQKVVQHAKKHGKRPAHCKFYVNEQCVRECSKKKENTMKNKQALCNKQSTFPQIKDELHVCN
jgi:hypothetical protein